MQFILAQATAENSGFLTEVQAFFVFIAEHWNFCLLHFLEFAIWGAWFVVLGNVLNARGFSRKEIGRIYATMPIGAMITPLILGFVADTYVNTEVLLGVSHLIGAVLLFAMARAYNPRPFYWCAFLYALAYSPTLNLVNSIVFAHDADIFGGLAQERFPWIRVFGTIGWIAAGLSHAIILRKDQPINERPLLLACGLSVILGLFAFTLPETRPAAAIASDEAAEMEARQPSVDAEVVEEEAAVGVLEGSLDMLGSYPIFFGVTFVAAMAMGLYFAFAALFIEKKGVPANTVGPVMTIGQWIEIFFILTLPLFLENLGMDAVLLIGVAAWSLRFGFFAIGKPVALLMLGIALHGICFDFFFVAGFINTDRIAPENLTATAQSLYGFLVYGLGMYLGSEGAGWLNQTFTKPDAEKPEEVHTNWRMFWLIPCILVTIAAVMFGISRLG